MVLIPVSAVSAAGVGLDRAGRTRNAQIFPRLSAGVESDSAAALNNNPCTICAFEGDTNCQLDTGQFILPSDRSIGVRRADDFRASGSSISRVCFEFAFLDANGLDCLGEPPDDDFEVRFYEDDFGKPGPELPDSPGASFAVDASAQQDTNQSCYTGPVDPPVQVNPDDCYWIEITGLGDECNTYWVESRDGNAYGYADDDLNYEYLDIDTRDVSFCIDSGIVPQSSGGSGTDGGCGDIPVACCRKDQSCDEVAVSECVCRPSTESAICDERYAGEFFYPYHTCPGNGGPLELTACPVPPNDVCDTDGDGTPDGAIDLSAPGRPCFDLQPDPDVGICNNPNSGNPNTIPLGTTCSQQADDCYDNSACLPWLHESGVQLDSYRCLAFSDNRLATTDGPPAAGFCEGSGADSFQADVWFTIDAPCEGLMTIDLCNSIYGWYDSMLAVFGDHSESPMCPGASNDDLLICDDDYCPCSGTTSGVQTQVFRGGTYLIRVGGWSDAGTAPDAGQSVVGLDIGFHCAAASALRVSADPLHQTPKHRYLSIDTTTNGPDEVALQVRLASMKRCSDDPERACVDRAECGPGVCFLDPETPCFDDGDCIGACVNLPTCDEHGDVGSTWWVQAPQTEPLGCLPGPCAPDDQFAGVDSTPHFQTWDVSTLHVGDCEIAPAATYEIRACLPPDGLVCGDPLVVATTLQPFISPGFRGNYGDVAGTVDTGTDNFTAPDEIANVVDVTAYVLTSQNYGTANLPQVHPTWVDLTGLGTGNPPNYILNISDLGQILKALQGAKWTDDPGNLNPGSCP